VRLLRRRSGIDLVSDILVLAFAVPLTFAPLSGETALVRPLGGVTFALLLAVALALLWRRKAPLAVAWITAAAALAFPLAELVARGDVLQLDPGVSAGPWWPPTAAFAAYAVMAHSERRRISWMPVAVMLAATLLLASMLPHESRVAGIDATPSEAFGFRALMVIGGAALLGMYVNARRKVVDGLRERAERAERERHLLAEHARADERARLAAEMHDVVAHRVTLMVLQAGALRVRAPNEETREAAEELRVTGAQALEELRDVIGLLRRSDDDEAPHHPLPDLSALVAESASVGVRVRLEESGDPPLASPVVGRTAYRIVREALTNVAKHAPGAEVKVYVRYGSRGVRLSIRNTAPTGDADTVLADAGSGTGLLGLRQRVELIGGRMRAGADRDGGFHVEVYLPAFVPAGEPVG
jgi:signal transduction histidine kinase